MALLCERIGITMRVRHGDTPELERVKISLYPPQLLITTPETLDALSVIESFNKNFETLEFLIIDEIHELFEDRRGLHLLLTINRLKEFKKKFKIIGLSATIANVEAIASAIFNQEDFVVINEETEREAEVMITAASNLAEFVSKANKILSENKSSIIFANTRSMAEILAYQLKAKLNINIAIHHSSLGREVREDVEEKLKKGLLKAVVSTSSLEYGIDIPNVDIVIQYGSPIQAKIFKQRVGRSQHRIGLKPRGVIFCSNPLEILESYILAVNSNKNNLEEEEISKDLDILIHHIIGLLLIKGSININSLYNLIRSINIYKDLNYDKFQYLLENIVKNKLAIIKNDSLFPLKVRAIPYYFNTISTIFEEPLYSCIDISSRKLVGRVDGRILYDCFDNNLSLILAGRSWKVVAINEEKSIAELSPIGSEAEAPIWVGEMLPVSRAVSEAVFDLLGEIIKRDHFREEYPVELDSDARFSLCNFIEDLKLNSPFVPSSDLFVIEKHENLYIIINPRGTKINRGIAILLKGILKGRILEIISNAYGIVIELKESLPLVHLIKQIMNIPKISVQKDVLAEILFEDYSFLSVLKQISIFTGVFRKDSFKELNSKALRSLRNSFTEEVALEVFANRYMNLDEAVRMIESLGNKIKILCYETKRPTPLSSMLISRLPLFREVVEKNASSIFEAVEQRLLEEEMLFVCTACKNDFVKKIRDLDEYPVCFKCGSKKISVVNPYDEGMMKVVYAFKKGRLKELKKFSNDYERFLLSAELVARYGKVAAMVMAGRGIGPEFARRILISWGGNKNDLIKEIINFEINFAKTRKYWADQSS